MLRLITAATALTVLVACDSEGIDRATDSEATGAQTVVLNDGQNVALDTGAASTSTANTGTDGAGAANTAGTSNSNTTDANTTAVNNAQNSGDTSGQTSDDTGSSASSGGISDDAGSSTSDGGISDDAGSSTSDGGISDDAGSSTSDGGIIADDAGSSTSDGGIIADDAGSASSDGGNTAETVTQSVTTEQDSSTQNNTTSDAGSFESDTGGNIIRVSSLTASGSENICTSAAAENNFSDTRVGDFILHNNAWRAFRVSPGYQWEQCITTNTNGAVVGWNYDWGPGVPGSNGRAADDFYVRSYPELIYGVKDEFRTSAPQSETGLPVRVSELPNIRIDYSYDGPQFGVSRTVEASNNPRFPNGATISGERNVAIESFYYEPDAAGNCSEGIVTRNGGSNHTFEVMVWLDAGAERLPAAPSGFVADLNIRGDQYKVYTKRDDPRYIAFVAQNPQTTGTIFWNDFTDWAKDNAHRVREQFGALSNTNPIQDSWCVANILVGTEIFWGAGNMNIFDWTITQSR